jgi:hypothetical protein
VRIILEVGAKLCYVFWHKFGKGKNGDIGAEEYRSWPVFRGLRSNKEVADAFSEVFGEPLIREKASGGIQHKIINTR